MPRILFVETPAKVPEPTEPVAAKVPMSARLARWVTCLCRDGKGDRITLTVEQEQLLRLFFDGPPQAMHVVEGVLAPCLALAAICGPTMGDARLSFATSDAEMWSVASPELRTFLDRDGQGRIGYAGKRPILTT